LAYVTCDHTNEQDEFTSHLLVEVIQDLLLPYALCKGSGKAPAGGGSSQAAAICGRMGSNAMMF
jgi:hypothetical protein